MRRSFAPRLPPAACCLLIACAVVSWPDPGGASSPDRAGAPDGGGPAAVQRLAFTSFAGDRASVTAVAALAESIRRFGGALRETPLRLYVDSTLLPLDARTRERLTAARVSTAETSVPAEFGSCPYAGKAFAAADAERALGGACDVLVRLDPDTLVLQEPAAFVLPPGVIVGYAPVHQVLVGSRAASPPDEFWSAVYRVLAVRPTAAFPVSTVLDGTEVRAYFNAGLVAVRPARGVFRRWRDSLVRLARDPAIREMIRQDNVRRMFLHQVALAGAVVGSVQRPEARQFPDTYNYPVSLIRDPDPLDRFVTIRYENLLTTPGWRTRVRASDGVLSWLEAHFPQ